MQKIERDSRLRSEGPRDPRGRDARYPVMVPLHLIVQVVRVLLASQGTSGDRLPAVSVVLDDVGRGREWMRKPRICAGERCSPRCVSGIQVSSSVLAV